jgi:hypothetical protein
MSLVCNKGLKLGPADAEEKPMGPVVAVVMGISWLAMVGISMLKDKVFLGAAVFLLTATALPLFGDVLAVVPIVAGLALALSGSLRYAKPTSFWARRFYDDEKRELARQRFAGEEPEHVAPPPEQLFRQRLGETLARLAHEHHCLGEEHADRVAHLRGLLLGRAREIEPRNARDGHLHREVDRVVGPADLLSRLHLLSHVLQMLLHVTWVAEHPEWESAFHHVLLKPLYVSGTLDGL